MMAGEWRRQKGIKSSGLAQGYSIYLAPQQAYPCLLGAIDQSQNSGLCCVNLVLKLLQTEELLLN